MGDRGFRGGGRGGGRGGRGGGRGGGGFKKSTPDEPRINSTVQIFVENLPLDAKLPDVMKYFSSVGPVKVDRLSKKPRIWLYHDKATNQPTGECTITYKDTQTQLTALQTFDGQYYQGNAIRVTPSIVKPHMAKPPPPAPRGGRGGPPRGRGGFGGGDRGGGGRGFGGRGGGPPRGRGGPLRGGGGHNANYEPLWDRDRGPPGGPMRNRGGYQQGGFGQGHQGQGGYGQGHQDFNQGHQGYGGGQFRGHQGYGGGQQRYQPY